MNDPLANLHDIHLPDPISWWPPAPGWWLLAILLVLLVVVGSRALARFYQKRAYRREACRELEQLQQANMADDTFTDNLAILLKRTAIAAGIPNAGKLQGKAWETCLAAHMPHDAAHTLAIARYQPNPVIHREALVDAARQWIKEHKA